MNRGIFYNTTAQLIAKFVSMSLTILATVLITRTFGKEGYGQFSLMQTLPALLYILADFGLNASAIKKIGSNDKKGAQEYYRTVLGLRLLLALVFLVVLNGITLLLPYSPFLKTGILLSSLLILTQALYSSTNLIFQYKQRYDLAAIGYIGGSVITLLLLVVFVQLGADIRWLSFTYVLGGTAAFLISTHFLGKLGYRTVLGINSDTAKQLLVNSLPLGLMFIFSQINFKADSILISLLNLPANLGLTNIEAVAVYALPYKVFEVALVLPTFFMNASYPIFVQKFKENHYDFKKVFVQTLRTMLMLGLTVSATLYLLAPIVISILGGQDFAQSVKVLQILSIGLFIFFLTQPISYFIVTLDKQRYLPAIYLGGAVFNVSANLLFIPKCGFYASAYITWLSESLILTMLLVFALKAWRGQCAAR